MLATHVTMGPNKEVWEGCSCLGCVDECEFGRLEQANQWERKHWSTGTMTQDQPISTKPDQTISKSTQSLTTQSVSLHQSVLRESMILATNSTKESFVMHVLKCQEPNCLFFFFFWSKVNRSFFQFPLLFFFVWTMCFHQKTPEHLILIRFQRLKCSEAEF